ncbi:MAG: DEAD/DEAH box helicase [Lentisphaeria bacterium]|nr:DEAD/DEAH box helicase [Lentisphaeria bacterium]
MVANNKNFEEKLIAISSAEAFKNAKQLLKNNQLGCAYRDHENCICASFLKNSTVLNTKVRTGENAIGECDCQKQHNDGKLCEHAIAAIMYASRFNSKLKMLDDGESRYTGMKVQNFSDFLNSGIPVPDSKRASLRINVISEFPHVPSKWENAVLSIKLFCNNREYLGNQNNLRHLYFDKMLAISLKLENFSLQDQQIIRYLAINGEPDSSNILLNSEQTAEFFHCLINFDNFRKDGRKLIIHGDFAEPVILKQRQGTKITISPAIKVNGSIMDLGMAKVITGRSGCWVGRQGEYYFVPAMLDVNWIRKFFRTGRQEWSGKLPDTLAHNGKFAVPVLETDSFELESLKHRIMLSGKFDVKSMYFAVNTEYIYKGNSFLPDSGRLAQFNGRFYRRDEETENAFETEFAMFGFEQENNTFILRDMENIGIFLDRLLPVWLNKYPNMLLDGNLARLAGGGNGLGACSIQCHYISQHGDKIKLSYNVNANGIPVSLKLLQKNAISNRNYLIAQNGLPVKCDENFSKFMLSFSNIAENINEEKRELEISFFSVPYFRSISASVPGALPPELLGSSNESADFSAIPAKTEKPDFVFEGTLRPYQQEGVDFLTQMNFHNFNVILADEMGLGKTIQVLAMLSKMQKKNMPPSLVVCPASLLFNWEREAAKFVPSMKTIQLAGANREEEWKDIAKYDLVIISYSICNRDIEFIRKTQFNFVILDEAQHIKNPGTANAQTCKSIRSKHRLVLTGTPLENSSEDLWSIFDFLHHGMLGSFNSFKKTYAAIADDPYLQKDLSARVSPFIKRRTKLEVAKELPPKQELTFFCEMPPEQRALYEEVRENGFKMLANYKKGNSVSTEIFTTLLRLRQICCHPQLLPDFQHGETFPSAKMELLHELLHENIDSGHKVLLFSQFTSILAVIEKYLQDNNIPYEYLDGTTRNRQQRVDRFNNDENIKVFLLSLKAGGTGLNLTSADTVIIYDPWWNPAVELQAADRTHRIGQTRPVSSIKLLMRDSIEEKILQLQEKKQNIFDNVIDNPASGSEKLSVEDIKFLLA